MYVPSPFAKFVLPCLSSVLLLFPLCSHSDTGQSTPTDWSDQSQQYIATRADELAQWVDSFFHSDDFETETANSFMRFRSTYHWFEERGNTTDIGFRGKATLPALSERITLVIYENDDPEADGNELGVDDQDDNTDVSLQYTDLDRGRHRIDYRVGIRSSGAFKSSLRYRYRLSYDDHSLQFTNKLRYRGDEGYETIMRYRHDEALSKSRLLQYRARLNYGEVTDGVEWSLVTTVTKQLKKRRAASYFSQISGITRPELLTTEYGAGVNYRASFGKPYFYWEVRPALYWIRPTIEDSRTPEWRVLARIEVLFD